MDHPITQKPKDVRTAEMALWAWTVWTCLYGIFDIYKHAAQITQSISEQTEGLVSLDPNDLPPVATGGYLVIAALSAWFIIKLGHGKKWSRSSFLWSFILQSLITLAPPYHHLTDFIDNIPDLGLQAIAVVLLYKWQSTEWFNIMDPPKKPAKP